MENHHCINKQYDKRFYDCYTTPPQGSEIQKNTLISYRADSLQMEGSNSLMKTQSRYVVEYWTHEPAGDISPSLYSLRKKWKSKIMIQSLDGLVSEVEFKVDRKITLSELLDILLREVKERADGEAVKACGFKIW